LKGWIKKKKVMQMILFTDNFDRMGETNKLLASQLAEKNKEAEISVSKIKELNVIFFPSNFNFVKYYI
jgi:hypothetical protein